MVATAAAFDDGPIAFRFPRGEGFGLEPVPARGTPVEIGRGRVLREGSAVALLSYGTRLRECLAAAEELAALGLSCTVADARFAKPLDTALVDQLARHHEVMVTLEEGSVCGFGALVMQHLAMGGAFDSGLKFRPMCLPDAFLDHDTPKAQYETAGLSARAIVAQVLAAMGPGAAAAAPARA